MTHKNRIAILLFHPLMNKSKVNRVLLKAAEGLGGITIRIMYDLYPDFHIDILEEQKILLEHDVVVWQHPFYWYSSPSLLKEWIDIVLQHGFAYGRDGKALAGKKVLSAITSGGRREVYQEGGIRKYSINQLLAPFEQTVKLCNMDYLPPFMVHGTHMLDEDGIRKAGLEYQRVLSALRDDLFEKDELESNPYFNDIIT
jgi:glutathione-regulated potassium-efflux system ancillary protein KefG